MESLEVPFPALSDGSILVRNHYSLISAGTEGKTVKDARLGYLGKARARQKEVQQVLQSVKTNGLVPTYTLVMNKLEAPSALGYSCAGEVLAVGKDVTGYRVGDWIACGGVKATHAEIVAVPQNLCVPVPQHVDLRHAAFTTVAAIALQGIRQAEVDLGGNCVVIGLGLIGLLTAQCLEAGGIQAIGIDLDPVQVQKALEVGASHALVREEEGLEEAIAKITRGAGADAVIITAGTTSLDPVELAGRLARKKGKVVVVGGVPTGFSRPYYYRKELDLRMSCSYGPGRYDSQYEEAGIDYPIGYVRWTEQRNMQTFVDLLAAQKIDVEPLITHTYALQEAPAAYQLVLERTEPFAGILLAYEVDKPLVDKIEIGASSAPPAKANIGFVGAGSFAQNILLPAVDGHGRFVGVATARPNNARYVADKYGFEFCTGDADDVFTDERIDTVFVVTRHNLHAENVLAALRNDKHVFVEKPLCLTREELVEIRDEYQRRNVHLMLGFNRRFAPHIERLKGQLTDGVPVAINYRINAGVVPPDHWVHDPRVGGGRILGEACHFVDLAMFLAGSKVSHVTASGLRDAHDNHDTVSICLGFENGSTASISYFSNGNKSVPKERLEVFAAGSVAIVEDFKEMSVYGSRNFRDKLRKQDKGHTAEIERFLSAIKQGQPTPIPFDEIYHVMEVTFKINESLLHLTTESI